MSVLLGDGLGGFSAARTFVADAEPQALALADLNDDGMLDPVAGDPGRRQRSDASPCCATAATALLQAVEDLAAGNGPLRGRHRRRRRRRARPTCW